MLDHRAAVFIDRDGCLTEEVGYVNHVSRLRLLPRAADAVRRLNAAGVPAVMVTNQAGIARGYFTESVLHAVNAELVRQLAVGGARLDGLYVCTHHPDEGAEPYRMNCDCRKPRPGLSGAPRTISASTSRARSWWATRSPTSRWASRWARPACWFSPGTDAASGSINGRSGRPSPITSPRISSTRSTGRWRARARDVPVAHDPDLVARLRGRRIVIVGDLIADEYLYGKPARISREAPVLILRFTEREVRPGGGANAAHNVRALGAHAVPVGVVGDDAAGAELGALFDRAGISTEGLVRAAGRRTPVKTRIMAGGYESTRQQVVRLRPRA